LTELAATGVLTINVRALLVPVTDVLVTVRARFAAVFNNDDGIDTVTDVAEMNTVGRVCPATIAIVVPAINPVPVRVTVRLPLPAATLDGDMAVNVGTPAAAPAGWNGTKAPSKVRARAHIRLRISG
jgi:hypothetical protein